MISLLVTVRTCKSWGAVTYEAGWPLDAAPPILTGR